MYILAVVSYSSRIYLSFPVMANAALSDILQAHSKMLGLVPSRRQLQPALRPLVGRSQRLDQRSCSVSTGGISTSLVASAAVGSALGSSARLCHILKPLKTHLFQAADRRSAYVHTLTEQRLRE